MSAFALHACVGETFPCTRTVHGVWHITQHSTAAPYVDVARLRSTLAANQANFAMPASVGLGLALLACFSCHGHTSQELDRCWSRCAACWHGKWEYLHYAGGDGVRTSARDGGVQSKPPPLLFVFLFYCQGLWPVFCRRPVMRLEMNTASYSFAHFSGRVGVRVCQAFWCPSDCGRRDQKCGQCYKGIVSRGILRDDGFFASRHN